MNRVILSPEYLPNPTIGRPISNADIYVGTIGLDPEIVGNQKQISVQQEDGTIVQVAQPINTGAGGVPLYNGSPVTILVDGNYSLKVNDKQGAQLYYVPSHSNADAPSTTYVSGEAVSWDASFTNGGFSRTPYLLADLVAIVGTAGQQATTSGRSAIGDGGGGSFVFDASDLSANVTADNLQGVYVAPTSDATGASGAWVRQYIGSVDPRWFGAVQGASDSTAAIQAAFDFGDTEFIGGYYALSDLVVPKDRKITGSKDCLLTHDGILYLGYEDSTGAFIAPTLPTVYFKQQHYTGAGHGRIETTAGSSKLATSVTVDDVSELSVGDLIFISNGYADMWRVVSDLSVPVLSYLIPGVDLWRSEVHKIRSIVANQVILDGVLGFDCPLIPTTYGLVVDENASAASVGFNTPNVEKLFGASNVRIDGLNILSQNNTSAIVGIGCYDVKLTNLNISAVGNTAEEQVSFHTSYNCTLNGNDVTCEGFSLSLRRGTASSKMSDNSVATSGARDSSVIVWEGAHNNAVVNTSIRSFGPPASAVPRVGIYLNACWDNTVIGVTGESLDTVVRIGFIGDGCTVSGIKGITCDLSFASYRAWGFTVDDINHSGYHSLVGNDLSKGYVVENYESNSFHVTNVLQLKQVFTGFIGAVRTVLCLNAKLSNINIPDGIYYDPSEADRTYDTNLLRHEVDNSTFYGLNLQSASLDLTDTRQSNFNNCIFLDNVYIKFSHYTMFENCTFLGDGVLVDYATYSSFSKCIFKCTAQAIDFIAANVSSSKGLIKFRECLVDAPSYFANYLDTTAHITGGSIRPFARGGEEVDVVNLYPQITTYKNPGQFGNQAGWVVV